MGNGECGMWMLTAGVGGMNAKQSKKNIIFSEAVNKPDRRQKYLMHAAASDSFLEVFIYLDCRCYRFDEVNNRPVGNPKRKV
jgi:hypothetical protein